MYPWNCCRTCLAVDSLNVIFAIPNQNHKYCEIIASATGIKIEMNDFLSQLMCANCINTVNEIRKFQIKCQISQKKLLEQSSFVHQEIKVEPLHVLENATQIVTIDISETNNELVNGSGNDIDQNIMSPHHNYDGNLEITIDKKENQHQSIFIPKSEICDIRDQSKDTILNTTKSSRKQQSRSLQQPKRLAKRTKTLKKNLENDQPKEDEGCKKETKRRRGIVRIKEKIECEYCHKVLTSSLSLRNHYKIHTGFDVVCEHCGKKFITRRLLLMHCRAKHGYEKTDKCSYCEYRASNAEQVKIHERLHTGEKPYVCKDCGNGFHRKSSYLQHVAIHLPEKTVQCDQCPARFKSTTLMRIHKNRHRQPQYSFKCYICHSSFARRRNVIRHLQRIHAVVSDSREIVRVKIS